ncbi:MAG: PIN domain-containing protein [Methanotrichaceae archaeon]
MDGREEEAGLVVDTNIIIAALLKDHSINAKLIKSGYFNVYFPDYGMIEIEGYLAYIKAKRKKSSQSLSLEYAMSFLLKAIQVVPCDLYLPKIKSAFEVMKEIDEKDAPILALAMQLRCPIWSNDKHFQRQKAAEVYTTSEVLSLLKEGSF